MAYILNRLPPWMPCSLYKGGNFSSCYLYFSMLLIIMSRCRSLLSLPLLKFVLLWLFVRL